ncbi:transposase [Leptospira noguchii]|uniref:transposase n=1 Tax=Leptospira noguchii TaxID=28182 RepID=UPI0009BF1D26
MGSFCEKEKRNQPLSNDSKILNKHLSKVRSRVEHVFADIKSFGGKSILCRGLARAELQMFLSNFVYNVRRFAKNLMTSFEEWGKNRGSKLIGLATRRAKDFYLALGYEESTLILQKIVIKTNINFACRLSRKY